MSVYILENVFLKLFLPILLPPALLFCQMSVCLGKFCVTHCMCIEKLLYFIETRVEIMYKMTKAFEVILESNEIKL